MAKGIWEYLFGKSADGKKDDSGMDERISDLENRMACIEKKLAVTEKKLKEQEMLHKKSVTVTATAVNKKDSEIMQSERRESVVPDSSNSVKHLLNRLYMNAPTMDGVFTSASENEEVGKSLYVLTTKDGVNGSFILLDSSDAIATAMISVTQFIKPVCKVIGNINAYPMHIITEEEGTAVNENSVWKVTKKAVIKFEN